MTGHGLASANRPTRVVAILATIATAAFVSGCKEVEKAEKVHYSPASVTPIKGDEDHKIVTLTAEGARRIDLRTGLIERGARAKVMPYAALLYEKDGETFVYTNPKPLTYVRAAVEVESVIGDRVILKRGPGAGTRVVTVGAQEVHGAELEFGEY